MTFQKRRQKILQLLDHAGDMDVHSLSGELGTSEITVRRDLSRMADDGMIYRTHGGAMKVDLLTQPKSFENKAAVNIEAKDKICRRAAEEIKDGDIIIMDCGSTVFRLCQFIRNKNIRVITNSLPVVYELANSSVAINLIGGELDMKRQAVHGKIAEEHIARYQATRAYLGADGISVNGLFANSEPEASMTLAFAARTKNSYLLCDASKIGNETYLKFAGLDLIQRVITDCTGKKINALRKKGASVLSV